MVARLELESEELRAILEDGAPVTIGNSTPYHATVTLGQEKPLNLFFPVPVLATDQKIRNLRKSSYIEVTTQVASVSNIAEFPTSFAYPLYLTGREKVPLAWNMSHLDLQKQPALDRCQVSMIDWLNTHFSLEMSRRERAMRGNESLSRSSGERVRCEFKDSLFSLLVQFSGLHGSQYNVFSISTPGSSRSSIKILIFPNKLRIDLATRTVVLDCAVLPLYQEIKSKMYKFINDLVPLGLVQIQVDDAELSMWKQILPAWVERCRKNWSHREECEYRAAGKVPLTDQHDDTTAQFLCSCGKGVFPDDFKLPDIPNWLSVASKYCTRAAISPIFWAPFAEDAYLPTTDKLGSEMPKSRCHVFGVKQTKDGKLLMRCGRYRVVEYCSAERQRKDWNTHKIFCSGRQN